MRCPFCERTMEKGFIQSGNRMMVWVKNKRLLSLSLRPKPGEVLLDNNYFYGGAIAAYLCRHCEKMIADYSENHEGES